MFLSLIAAGIIQLLRNNESMQCSIKRVYAGSNDGLIEATIGVPFYKRDDVCWGINLFCEDRVRRQIPVIASEI